MADAANTISSVEIFLDEVRSRLSGSFDYEPADASEKWIYAEVLQDETASADLLSTTAGATTAYPNFMSTSTAVAGGDKVLWIAIKNTSSTAAEGLAVCFDAGPAAFDDNVSAEASVSIIVGPGELFTAKVPNATVADVHGRTCVLSNAKPSSQGSAEITVLIAAILDDA